MAKDDSQDLSPEDKVKVIVEEKIEKKRDKKRDKKKHKKNKESILDKPTAEATDDQVDSLS